MLIRRSGNYSKIRIINKRDIFMVNLLSKLKNMKMLIKFMIIFVQAILQMCTKCSSERANI